MSSATATAGPAKKWGASAIKGMQKIGRSLQLPVAALPAAGLLSRLGQDDALGKDGLGWNKLAEVCAHAGGALFGTNLALLFCVGVAIGFAKKADGSTAFAALVGFLVYREVLTGFVSDVTGKPQDPGVLGGIVVGLTAAVLWEKYHRTRLPDWLGFFSGRRFIPILMSFAGLGYGLLFGYAWGPIGDGLNNFSEWLSDNGAVGSGIFGVVNRLLIPIGMHMLLNSFAWFQFGEFTADGETFRGDIARYMHDDPSSGMFMTGFFPIMMFALPAAALAIAHCARPERRKAVLGMMVSISLTAFVTGVTEPLEFSFMFIAPVLYGIHAVLTGVSMALTWALGIRGGFTFSGGLIDYLLGYSHGEKVWMLIPIGLAFAAVYYVVFRFAILTFNLPTPGREPEDSLDDAAAIAAAEAAAAEKKASRKAGRAARVPEQGTDPGAKATEAGPTG
ncbi:PTS transporter subunit EIIC [Streptomyces sp. NPDC018031]|uniref:PTS transporter subunit EIIC n=1 Tax=Streptomyces sp. NPDC018031 TaxID=3365033 RepID=UPI00378CE9F4